MCSIKGAFVGERILKL